MGILISVIIPIYNGKQYIRQCLISIRRQNTHLEVIIIDDGSTDGLIDEIEDIKKEIGIDFIYIRNEKNLGVAKARRIGIERASGTHIAFLDADDWWHDDKISKQMRLIAKGCQFTYTGRRNIYENGEYVDVETTDSTNYIDLLRKNPITCSSVIITKDLAIYASDIDAVNICDDYIIWLMIAKYHCVAKGINEPLVSYRVHRDSQSGNKFKQIIRRYRTYRMMNINVITSLYFSIEYIIIKLFERRKWVKKEFKTN